MFVPIAPCCAQQVKVNVEELLSDILPKNERILIVTGKYYWPSTLLVPYYRAIQLVPAQLRTSQSRPKRGLFAIVCCMPIVMKLGYCTGC